MHTEKKHILSDALNQSGTGHLLPIIDFLKVQGNEPSTGDQFYYYRDGNGVYGFAQPLDVAALRAQFEFPSSIHLTATSVHDIRHFVCITQNSGPLP
ncbi:hypothetical protein [Hymenobacter guriensis]|uniref:Uncharacterized protein n=1 Tax=Hymenobacter guriensis TaxID=2793065 RepID=A0ABS0L4Q0_9BACT|nr:hypothetical protein [Hymenobacter guriensis]MBG8555116.1 hypothetical protein [Hymenobacter guriensis]